MKKLMFCTALSLIMLSAWQARAEEAKPETPAAEAPNPDAAPAAEGAAAPVVEGAADAKGETTPEAASEAPQVTEQPAAAPESEPAPEPAADSSAPEAAPQETAPAPAEEPAPEAAAPPESSTQEAAAPAVEEMVIDRSAAVNETVTPKVADGFSYAAFLNMDEEKQKTYAVSGYLSVLCEEVLLDSAGKFPDGKTLYASPDESRKKLEESKSKTEALVNQKLPVEKKLRFYQFAENFKKSRASDQELTLSDTLEAVQKRCYDRAQKIGYNLDEQFNHYAPNG